MSLLPGQILPADTPIGQADEDGRVTINHDYWLFFYNLALQVLGTSNSGLPSSAMQELASLDSDATDTDAIALRAPVTLASVYAQDLIDVSADVAALRQAVSNALVLAQDVLPQDPVESTGKFTGTLKENSGGTTLGTGTCVWSKVGKHCILQMPSIQATSAATDMTLVGLPGDIQPATLAAQVIPCALENNGSQIIGTALITPASATITFSAGPNGAAFTAAGQKGVIFPVLAYLLN